MIKTEHRRINDGYKLKETHLNDRRHELETKANGHQVPVVWDSAVDYNVFDKDGNKWIDMTAGIFAANAGHSNPEIKKAIQKQLDKNLIFAYQYITEIRQEFVEKLLDSSPDHFDKTILLNTGSEVTDAAYKLIKLWAKKNNKKYIVTFNGSYHGRVLGSALICGTKTATDWSSVADEDVVFIDFPTSPDTEFDPSLLPPADQIAAFFLETYQGWAAWMYPPQYIQGLYKFARDNGALVCFDEVQAGFYRMGEMYGYMTYGENIKPDLICLGKGISSSLPMAALLGTADIIDVDLGANLSGTHAGNALGSAACLANLEVLTDKQFQKDLKKRSKVFEERSNNLLKYDCVTNVNARGMVVGIVFDTTERTNKIVFDCIESGVLPVCTFRESIKLGPPLTIPVSAINEAFDVLEECIQRRS
jgi:4-aminobutyrate aminotransferase/(S)-3-amino-2-methylpropionate transaminase|tara:strand:+ start:1948 stop:3204 length:1257 start_codon:yes stop_codon:yes gene_type:complete